MKKNFYITILFAITVTMGLGVIVRIFSVTGQEKLKAIENGNYRYIDDKRKREQLSKMFSINADNLSWIYKDLNNDGEEELILQAFSDTDKIVGVFTLESHNVVTVLWDDIDVCIYYQVCEKGLLHYTQYYGTYDFEQYELRSYDEEWNEIYVDGLEWYYLLEEEEEVREHLGEHLENMEIGKVYFWEFNRRGDEKAYTKLTQEEWKNKFYTLFGKNCESEELEYFIKWSS